MSEDYYKILGIPRTASASDVRSAYLRLAREAHPDRFPDPAEREEADRRFQLINEAFNHLRDENQRREYDKSLEEEAVPPKKKAAQRHKDGELLEQSREYEKALNYYYEATRLDPENMTYVLSVARVLSLDRSKARQAAELFEQVISKAPHVRESYLGLGALYSKSGLLTRALRVYERARKELPTDAELKSLHSQTSAAVRRGKK
jgi:curved DNA-binding protein CbpA